MLLLILVGLIVAPFMVCLVADIEFDNTSALSVYDQLQYDAAITAAHKAGMLAGEYYGNEYSKAYQAVMAQFKSSYPVKF